MILVLILGMHVYMGDPNPHQPHNLTWQVLDTSIGDTIIQLSKTTPQNTWFPELGFDLRALFPDQEHWDLRIGYYYVCPGKFSKLNSQQWEKQYGQAPITFVSLGAV